MTRSIAVDSLASFLDWAEDGARGVVFAGVDPHYAIGLEDLLPGYRVACAEDAPALTALEQRGVPTLVGAPADGDDGPRSTAALLALPATETFLTRAPCDGVLVFKSSHRIESRCHELRLPLLAAPARVARRWENKIAFLDIAGRLGLPLPTARVVEPASDTYELVAKDVGETFVLQAPHGFSGAKTVLVGDPDGFDRAVEALRARRLRATRHVSGRPLTLNACVTARGVAAGSPFGQLTGEPDLTPHPLGSCGNDWHPQATAGIDPEPFVELARRIGDALAGDGFRGLFGVDFVLGDDGRPYVIEVNPRLVASIALFTQLEVAAGRLPLLARHILAFLDPEVDQAALDGHRDSLAGAQAILHNLSPRSASVGGGLQTGAYRLVPPGNQIALVRPALRVDELRGPEELLVLAPAQGRVVKSGGSAARLQMRRPVMDRDGALREDAAAAVNALRHALGLREA